MKVLLVILLSFCGSSRSFNCSPRIGIVGGGIGGASASRFLTELFNGTVNMDLYEAKSLGGRLATVTVNGDEYEAGGSIIHPRNRYMDYFTKLLGLSRETGTEKSLGIWNGDEFPYKTSEWKLMSLANLIARYGLQPFKLKRYVSSVLNEFEKIYDLQDAGISFGNVSALLAAMNDKFPEMLTVSMEEHLTRLGFSRAVIEELAKSTVVVNYGQETDIQSFVGCVSLAAVGADLWAVKGGNKRVPEQLITKNSNVHVLPSRVTKIINTKTTTGKTVYELHSTQKGVNTTKIYDILILAIPLTQDQPFRITFEGFPRDTFALQGFYHTLRVTFLQGKLNKKYFHLKEDLDAVLSCQPSKTVINSLSRLDDVNGHVNSTRNVWKVFSNGHLREDTLNSLFLDVENPQELTWKAYPEYSTNIPRADFKLHDGIYHVNAIEWAASAMEMSAIGGRNVAILVHNEFTRNCHPGPKKEENRHFGPTEHSEL